MQDDDKKYSPLLPFDGTQMDNFQIYDNVKYTCKLDLRKENIITMHNENMVKYYECLADQAPVKIGGN